MVGLKVMKKIFFTILLLIFSFSIFACSNEDTSVATISQARRISILKSNKYLLEINFGAYQQSKDEGGEFLSPIRWSVLDIDEKNKKALIVSQYSLEYMKFYDDEKQSSWKDSFIRKWLNKDFYDKAFNDEEKKHIKSSKINNKNIEGIRVKQGDNTTDKVFLLSVDEFRNFSDSSKIFSYSNTYYAESKFKFENENKGSVTSGKELFGAGERKRSEGSFWLRNNGIEPNSAMFVDFNKNSYSDDKSEKYIDFTGINGFENSLYVKPAMYVDISLVVNEAQKYIESKDSVALPDFDLDSYVYFGNYYKSNEYDLEPIEWKVIAKTNEKALLMSRYGLEYMPYNIKDESVTWETSSIRKWLNEDFYNVAFDDEEKKSVLKNLSKTGGGAGGNLGRDTYDFVTLLSYSDLINHCDLGDIIDETEDITRVDSLKCYQTRYALNSYKEKTGRSVRDEYNPVKWWLRDVTATYKNALVFDYKEDFPKDTYNCTSNSILVRPAIWVKIGGDESAKENTSKKQNSKSISIHKDAKMVNVGKYYIDNDSELSPISWEIIEKDTKNKKALLLSQYIIECATVSDADKWLDWENSNIREFLNGEFFNEIFTEDEKEAILYTNVNNDSKYGIVESFRSTEDRLFIMSRDEIEKYFKTLKSRSVTASKYVMNKYFGEGLRRFRKRFLRSSRFGKGYMDYMTEDAKFSNTYIDKGNFGDENISVMAGLRVAMWVNYSESKLNTYKAKKGNYTDVFRDMIEKKVPLDELPLNEELLSEMNGDMYAFFGIYNDEYHSYKVSVHNKRKEIVIFELKQDDNKSYEDASYGDKGLKLREIRYNYDIDENGFISNLKHHYTDTFYDENFNLKKNGIEFRVENLLTIIKGLCQGQHYRDARVKFYDKDYGWCIDTNVFALTENFRKKHDLRYSILNKEIFEEKAKKLNEQYHVSDIPSTIELEFELDYNDKKSKELFDEGKMQVRFDYKGKRYYYEIKFTHNDEFYLDDVEVSLIKTLNYKKDELSGYTYLVDENGELMDGETLYGEKFNHEW